MHVIRGTSFGHLSLQKSARWKCTWLKKYPLGISLVVLMSIGNVAGWAGVHRGCVWLR